MNSNVEKKQIVTSAKIVIILIGVLLLIPVMTSSNLDHKLKSKMEKRELSDWPSWVATERMPDYFSGVESYLDDHIGLSVFFNSLYRQLLFFIFNDPPVSNISIGKNGFLFLNSHSHKKPFNIYKKLCQIDLSKKQEKKYIQNLINLARFFEEIDYSFVYAATPSKPALYPDYLPDNLPNGYKESCLKLSKQPNYLQKMTEELTKQGILFFYPYADFYNQRLQFAFYPKESFHWKGESAHLFSTLLLHKMDVSVQEIVEKKQIDRYYSDLTMLGFDLEGSAWKYQPVSYELTKSNREPKDIINYYRKAKEYAYYESSNPISNKHTVLLSNSFGQSVAPFLAAGFASLLHVNIDQLETTEFDQFFKVFLKKRNVDMVILLMQDAAFVKSPFLKRWNLYYKANS